MRLTTDPQLSDECEKLVYFALLRQMETPCQALRDAYQRLARAASQCDGSDIAIVILNWLESELMSARVQGGEARDGEGQLMQAAIAFVAVLKQ
jgi:hypothetical protein